MKLRKRLHSFLLPQKIKTMERCGVVLHWSTENIFNKAFEANNSPNHLQVEPRYYHGDGSKITLLPWPWYLVPWKWQ